jgi:hypothetical protein
MTLIAHCGSNKMTREELALVPTPDATRTHQPVPHHRIVEALIETLGFRHLNVVRDEYAVSYNGMKMFGVLDLETEWSGVHFAIGVRNANDKTMRLALTVGYRVFVCDNMAFSGDFSPVLHKHSSRFDLVDMISVGVDKIQRNFEPLGAQILDWRERELTTERAKLAIYGAFVEGKLTAPRHLLPAVHKQYFEPEFEEFKPRTMWSLSNAFTTAFKQLKPITQFQATAKLGTYLQSLS